MAEQYLAGVAYGRKAKIAIEYYFKRSAERADGKFAKWLRRCRNGTYALFILAIVVSAIALVAYGRDSNERSDDPAAAAAS